MTDQYLILHKVRGEAAFDVAEQLAVNGELWWIIPTSGHRAYPYQTWHIDPNQHPMEGLPPEWPDHYTINDTPKPQPKPTPKPSRTPTLDDLD